LRNWFDQISVDECSVDPSPMWIGGGPAEFLEPVVDPIQEKHLAIELILAGRYDFVELVLLAELLELRIVAAVELESLREVVLHQRQHVELRDRRLSSGQIEG
jgi:hypothetical protein